MGQAEPTQHIGQDGAQLAGAPRGNCLRAQLFIQRVPFGRIERGIEMRVVNDRPDGIERFGRAVRLGIHRNRGRDDGKRNQETLHFSSALIDAGGSNTAGSTLSYSIEVSVIFCSTPLAFCVSTVGCISFPNFLYSPMTLV